MTKLTKEQHALFRKECDRLQVVLGLQGWKIYHAVKKLSGVYATTHSDALAKVATLELNAQWEDYPNNPPSAANIRGLALHEMLHVFLADLTGLAHSRFLDAGEIDEAEHRIVRTLEKLLKI